MEDTLRGRTAVVPGSGLGLGLAVAGVLTAQGANVVMATEA